MRWKQDPTAVNGLLIGSSIHMLGEGYRQVVRSVVAVKAVKLSILKSCGKLSGND